MFTCNMYIFVISLFLFSYISFYTLIVRCRHSINSEKKIWVPVVIESTTLCDLDRCSSHWTTGDSMVSKGEMWAFDWNSITWSHSQIMTWHIWVGGAVTSWLVHSSLDPAVWVWAPGRRHCFVFLGKTLLSVLLSTQVYKWVPANLMLGVALQWTGILSRGSRNTPSHLMWKKPGYADFVSTHNCIALSNSSMSKMQPITL